MHELKTKKVWCVGDSMMPSFPKKGWQEVHFFERNETKNLKIGDVVVYRSKGFNREGKPRFWHKGQCIHRIVKIADGYAMIKGAIRDYYSQKAML